MAHPKNKIFEFYPLILILLVGVLSYSNTFHGPFVFDDAQNIVEYETIHLDSLSPAKLAQLKFGGRPVARLSFALNYYLGELDPFGYHLLNLLIHLLTAVLVYLFLKLTLNLPSLQERYGKQAREIALLTALLFVVHPIQTQAVTYIVQRMASLAALFFLLALYCYAKARLAEGKLKAAYFAGTALATLLALGSKENAITLPLFILLYDYYFRQGLKLDPAKKKKIYLALGLGLLVSLLAGIYYLGFDFASWLSKEYQRFPFTPGQRMLTQLRVVIFYLSLLIVPLPSRLNLDHQFPLSYSLLNPPTTLLCLILVLALIGISIYLAKKRPLISFFIIWFWGNLLLESSVLPLDMVFEHRLYLPSVGFFVLVTLALLKLFSLVAKRYRLKTKLVAMGLLITILGWGTYQRNMVWSSEISLWSDVAKKSPNKARAHNNLGSVYSQEGQYGLAIKALKRALEIKPKFAQAFYNMGLAYNKKGDYRPAVNHLQQALKIKPKAARIYHALGDVFYAQKNWNQAVQLYQQALSVDAGYTPVYYNLGTAYRKMGNPDNSLQVYKKLKKIKPNDPEVYLNIGRTQFKKGLHDKAIIAYEKALQLKPNYFPAHYELGKLYSAQGKYEKAVKEFTRVIKLNSKHTGAHYNLGLSYQNLSRYNEAVDAYLTTLKLSPENAGAYKNLGIIYLYHLKDKNRALKYLNRSLELAPNQFQAERIKQIISTSNLL